MNRLIALSLAVAFISSASAATTTTMTLEVLVLTTATDIPRLSKDPARKSIEIQNLGPNPIFCAVNANAEVNKSRMIAVDAAWGLDLPPGDSMTCITTVNQVTTNATIVTQVR